MCGGPKGPPHFFCRLHTTTMLFGLLAAIGTLFAWTGGTFAFLTASRRIPPALLNRSRLLLAAGATAVLAIAFSTLIPWQRPWQLWTLPTTHQWMWLGASALVGLTVGDFFGFTGLRILGARRQSVIGTISPVAAGIGGWLLLQETISVVGMLGMGLSIGGVMWAMSSAEERTDVHREGYGTFTTGVLMAIGGALCQGFGLVLAKIGLSGYDGYDGDSGPELHVVHAAHLRMIVGFSLTYLLDALRRDRIRPLREAFADRAGARTMAIATLLGPVTGVSLSLYAANELGVAVAQTIFSLVPFLVMAVAAVRQHERIRWQSVAGAIVAVAGVVLLVTS